MTTPTIPELEVWLDEHGVRWTLVEDLDVAEVDVDAGLANQARHVSLDEEVVERYAADMAAGATFPPVVLNHDGDRLVPVGGNHRIAAALTAGTFTVAAYVLDDIDEDTAHLLAIEDNRRHGLPLSEAERLHHAVALTQSGRHTLDLDGWYSLSNTSRARLAALPDDVVFAKATRLAVRGTIPASALADIVGRVNRCDTTAGGLELLTEVERAARGRTFRSGGARPSAEVAPRARLLGDLDGIMRFRPDDVAADCHTAEERRALRSQIKATARHLMAVDAELGR